jgi:hypothetical protein
MQLAIFLYTVSGWVFKPAGIIVTQTKDFYSSQQIR